MDDPRRRRNVAVGSPPDDGPNGLPAAAGRADASTLVLRAATGCRLSGDRAGRADWCTVCRRTRHRACRPRPLRPPPRMLRSPPRRAGRSWGSWRWRATSSSSMRGMQPQDSGSTTSRARSSPRWSFGGSSRGRRSDHEPWTTLLWANGRRSVPKHEDVGPDGAGTVRPLTALSGDASMTGSFV